MILQLLGKHNAIRTAHNTSYMLGEPGTLVELVNCNSAEPEM